MARTTHTHAADPGQSRPTEAGPVPAGSGERSGPGAPRPGARGRPTDTQVWNWAESAVLLGYGPPASSFL
ncbi:hypothetical protein E6R60_14975 [Streptomyces sp. A0642]|nr:hypothetical protein E6R60_14975 [Streptomyces sp. A0642]